MKQLLVFTVLLLLVSCTDCKGDGCNGCPSGWSVYSHMEYHSNGEPYEFRTCVLNVSEQGECQTVTCKTLDGDEYQVQECVDRATGGWSGGCP